MLISVEKYVFTLVRERERVSERENIRRHDDISRDVCERE